MKKKILVLLLLMITILITLGGLNQTDAARICSNCQAGNHVNCPNRGYTHNSTSHSIWCCCGKTFANAEMHYNSHYLNDSTYCYICVCGYKEKHNTSGGHCSKAHCPYNSSRTLCNRGCNHAKWVSCRDHSYSSTWTRTATHHWKKCTVSSSCTATKSYGAHVDNNGDGKCDVCEISEGTSSSTNDGGGGNAEATDPKPGAPVVNVKGTNFTGTSENNVVYSNSNVSWNIETEDSISKKPLKLTEYDLSGATTGGNAVTRAGRYNRNGSNAGINSQWVSSVPSTYTFETWIYLPVYGGKSYYIFHTGKGRYSQLYISSDGNLVLYNSSKVYRSYVSQAELQRLGFYSGWAYLSVQAINGKDMNRSNVVIYINGQQAELSIKGTTSSAADMAKSRLQLGGYYSNNNVGLPDGSMMKETKIFNTGVAASSADRMYTEMNSSSAYWSNLIGYWKQVETSGSTMVATAGVSGMYANNADADSARDVSSNYTSAALTNNKFTGTISAEGTTRITANHVGMLGATSETTVDVVIDKTAPTGTIFASTYNTNQNSVTLYVTASDDSGISGVNINGWFGGNWSQYNSSKSATYNNTTGQWEVTYNFSEIQNTTSGATNQGQGIYYFDAHIYDNAGNWGIASAVTVAYDTQAPWITGAMSVEGLTGSEPTFYTRDVTSTVTLKSTGIGDNLSGPSHFDYYIRRDGAARTYDYNYEQAVDEDTGTGYVKYKLNGQGRYVSEKYIYDRAGNCAACGEITIIADHDGPWILSGSVEGATLKDDGKYYVTNPTGVVTLNNWDMGDNLSGLSHFDYYLSKDGAERTKIYNAGTAINIGTDSSNTTAYVKYKFNGYGTYTTERYIYDKAGNLSACGPITFVVAPESSQGVIYTSASLTNQPTVTVSVAATDESSGVANVIIYGWKGTTTEGNNVLGQGFVGGNATYNSSTGRWDRTFTFNDLPDRTTCEKNQGDGVYAFDAHIINNAGTDTYISPVNVTYDSTAPTVVGITYNPGWKKEPVTINVHFTDALSGVNLIEYSYDLNSWYSDWDSGSGSNVTKTWSEEGDRVVYFRATDYAGNTWIYAYDGTNPSPYDLKIDKTLPNGTVSASTTCTNQNGVTIYVNATDALSGVDQVKMMAWTGSKDWVKTNTEKSTTFNSTTGLWEVSFTFDEIRDTTTGALSQGDGNYYFGAHIYDKAGNRRIVDGTAVIYDTTPPQITSITYDPGWKNVDITKEIEATDTLSGVKLIEYSYDLTTWYSDWESSGKGYAKRTWTEEGDRVVYFRATDNAGNTWIYAYDGTNPSAYDLKIDKTKPVTGTYTVSGTTFKGGKHYVTSETAEITLNFTGMSDNLSGLKLFDVYMKKDGADRTKDYNVSYSINGSTGEVKYKLNGYGTYVTEIYLYDNAGNLKTCLPALTINAVESLPIARLMERESYEYVSGKYVYYAIGAKRSNNKTYTADLISSITFVDNVNVPNEAEASWDASFTDGDNKVIAWVIPNTTDSTKYDLYIGADDITIVAPANSNGLFREYKNCTAINNLTMLDTSNVTDMSSMFENCSNLPSLDVRNFDTTNVTDTDFMFSDCSSLTSLDVSNFNTSQVTNMNHMFNSCRNLPSLDVSNFNTSKVTNMSSMFYNCSSLPSLDVSNFNTSNVTDMGYMFYNCRSLTSLDVSTFDTSKVTDMNSMFDSCRSLPSLDVSNFDTSKVTDMRSMFFYCSSLTSLDVSNFNTSNVTNMGSMFNNCSSLSSLDVSNFDTSQVKSMGSMFYGCRNLKNLDLRSFDTASLDGKTSSGSTGNVIIVDVNYMFASCSNLESIVFGNNFNRLDGYDMFKDCSDLKAIITTKEITSSGNAPTLSGTENVTNSSGKIIAGPNGLIDLPNAILYVPNTTSEAAYEAATNYTTVFGADRIRPILELAGDNPVKVSKGATYVDRGVTVAGMTKNADGTTYTPYGYTVSGPVIKKDGTVVSSIDTSNVGTYTLTYTVHEPNSSVDGMSVIREVEIESKDISENNPDITVSIPTEDRVYKDAAYTPVVTVKDGATTLVEGKDYSVSYSDNINAGMATVTIKGINNYTGTRTENFMITQRPVTIKPKDATKEYDTLPLTSNEPEVTAGSLVSGHEITLTTTGTITNVGTVENTISTLIIKDASGTDVTSNYDITKGVGTLTVTEADNVDFDITLDNDSFVYDGTQKEPGVTIKVNGVTLEEGKDYDVSYKNNKDAGTATVTITGKGNYEGSNSTKDFTITKRPLEITAGSASKVYNGTALTSSAFSITSGTSLAPDQTLSVTTSGTITNVGTTSNVIATYNIYHNGENVTANYSVTLKEGILEIKPATITGSVIITGTNRVGKTLTAEVTVNPSDASLTYAWYYGTTNDINNATVITGANAKTYSPTTDKIGMYIFVKVTASKENYNNATFTDITDNENNKVEKVGDRLTPYLMAREVQTVTSNGVTSEKAGYAIGAYRAGNTKYTSDLIKSVTIINLLETNAPTTYEAMWDVSRDENEAVYAWAVKNQTNSSMYDLYIGGEGTLVLTNGKRLFADYTKCDNINGLNKMNSTNVTDMSYMFSNLASMSTLDVSVVNTSSVTNMEGMFMINNLTTLNVSGFDTSKVTNMSKMFKESINLTSLNINGFNTANTNNMSQMFMDCGNITSLNVSAFNTSNVTNMSAMFMGMSKLETLNVTNFNTANVTDMSSMFASCLKVQRLDLHTFNTAKVTNINGMFTADSSMKSILLGEEFNKLNGSNVFTGCSSLKAIIAQKKITASSEAMTLSATGTGLNTLTNATLYVPNLESKGYYETATNYATVFGEARVKPILEIIGSNPVHVTVGTEYVDQGAKVAGFEEAEASEYTVYGYTLSVSGLPVDTSTVGTKLVIYTVKYKDQVVVTGATW